MTAKELREALEGMPEDLEVVAMSEFDQANEILKVNVRDAWIYTGTDNRDQKIIVLE